MRNQVDLQAFTEKLDEFNIFKYAAYRTALKVRKLQTLSKLHLIELGLFTSVLEEKQFCNRELNFNLTWQEAEDLINSLYGVIKRQFGFVEDTSVLTNFLLSFLSSVFCGDTNLELTLCQMRVTLTLLCAGKLSEKYKFIFHQFSSNGYMNKECLHLLFDCIAKVTEFLGEKLTFGKQLVPAAVKNCLCFCKNGEKVSELGFLKWLSYEPQSLVWLSTHYRLSVSEKIEHSIKCNVCKSATIVGLRYKCLFCIHYNLCQQCFLRGFVTKGHERKHPVQEYCKPATYWEEVKSTMTAVRNKVFMTSNDKHNYLSYVKENLSLMESGKNENSFETLYSNPIVKELCYIVNKLEEENRQIKTKILSLDSEIRALSESEDHLQKSGKTEEIFQQKQSILHEHTHQFKCLMNRLRELLQLKPCAGTNSIIADVCMEVASPPLKFPKIGDYYESTPIAHSSDFPKIIPQNLRHFIKHQARLDGVENLSKAVSNVTQNNVLYSVADIEMNSLTTYIDEQGRQNSIDVPLMVSFKRISNTSFEDIHEHIKDEETVDNSNEFQCESGYPSSKVSEDSQPSSESLNTHSGSSEVLSGREKSAVPASIDCCPSSFSNREYSSTQFIEAELQQILEQLEQFFPKVTGLQNSTMMAKGKFISALSEMEDALRKLSNSSTQEESISML